MLERRALHGGRALLGRAEPADGRDERCGGVASFAEDHVGGEKVLALLKILARLAVDRDQRLEPARKVFDDRPRIGGAQARAHGRGMSSANC